MSSPSPASRHIGAGSRPERLTLDQIPHLRSPYASDLESIGRPSLDYHSLGGLGLERLVFHLLLAEGSSPRYFGKSGQRDFGVDLLIADGQETRLYQCKNLQNGTPSELRRALDDLEKGWLGAPAELWDVPSPDLFVICCPVEQRSSRQGTWNELAEAFSAKHQVRVELWHKDILDAKLRRQPDIVADLFSVRAAESFCELDNWNEDLFRPLVPGSGERRTIGRYLELREADHLVIEPESADRFEEILSRTKVIFLLGASGSGKTMTALALADRFKLASWRVFFVSLRHEFGQDRLVEGIERRCTRPTLFVLDDCHRDFDLIEQILDRLEIRLAEREVRFIVTAQELQPAPGGHRAIEVELLRQAEEQEQVIRLEPSQESYRQILAKTLPSLDVAEPDLVEYIFNATARDLQILALYLDGVESQRELMALDEPSLFDHVLRRYFGGTSIVAPRLCEAAALAQFDVDFPVREANPSLESHRASGRLTEIVGQPPVLSFVHASAAEVVFRALCHAAADDWTKVAYAALVEFLTSRFQQQSADSFRDVTQIQSRRLRLADDAHLKSAVFAAREVVEAIGKVRQRLPIEVLSKAAYLTRNLDRGSSPYAGWLVEAIENLIAQITSGQAPDRIPTVRMIWRSLELADEEALRVVEERFQPQGAWVLLDALGTIPDLFSILASSSPSFAVGVIDHLDPARLEDLIQRTLGSGRSIGTLSLAMRDLAQRQVSGGQETFLGRLEGCFGAETFLRLLASNGTLPDLFSLLRNGSEKLATDLLDQLDSDIRERLVERTLSSGRSIGTLGLAMRDLAQRQVSGGQETLLGRLESCLGAETFLRLLASNGTLPDLFSLLQNGSEKLATDLLDQLDSDLCERLAERTLASERSIRSWRFAIRSTHGRRLEEAIGPELWWRLIFGTGDLMALSFFLPEFSDDFKAKLFDDSAAPDRQEWHRILGRADFYSLCRFFSHGLPEIPGQLASLVTEIAPSIVVSTLQESTWYSVSRGAARAAVIGDPALRKSLDLILHDFLSRIEVDRLDIEEYREAVSAISVLWRYRPETRQQLANRLWKILPTPDRWTREDVPLVSSRILLGLAKYPEISKSDVPKLVEVFSPLTPSHGVDRTHDRSLLLFLWSLFALWFERLRQSGQCFRALQPTEFWSALLARIAVDSARLRGTEAKLDRLSLAGMVAFLVPELEVELRLSLKGQIQGLSYIRELSDSSDLISAFFALEGLSLLCPRGANFTPDRCQSLLELFRGYDPDGPALDLLRERLRR